MRRDGAGALVSDLDVPDKNGYKPAYDQKYFSEEEKRGKIAAAGFAGWAGWFGENPADNELYATVLGAERT